MSPFLSLSARRPFCVALGLALALVFARVVA